MLDINALMKDLASRRPIFHSEADFQHSLAWLIHETMPDCQVRLEYPFQDEDGRRHLDIWILSLGIAIELKYHTRNLEVSCEGEHFALQYQSAEDGTRYGFLKDIQRIERLVTEWDRCKTGLAILLTNNPLLWDPRRSRKDNNDGAFHLFEGREIEGEKAWSDRAGSGTTKNREAAIRLKDSYNLRWQAYSDLEQKRYGEFRYLAVSIA